LCAAGSDVTYSSKVEPARDLVLARAVDLLVVDLEDLEAGTSLIACARPRVQVIAVTRTLDSPEILDLVCEAGVDHVIARDPVFDIRALVVSAEKILRQEPFGLRKYMSGFGLELMERDISGAADRDEAVEQVEDAASELALSRGQIKAIGNIADELITNAVYNAPRDEEGRARYEGTSRRVKVELEEHERVRLHYGSDGFRFGIAVTDPFGALTRERVQSAFRRCLGEAEQIENKDGGAGLGLYTVLKSCCQLVINVEPGRRTEVVALVDLERRPGLRALHFFSARAEEAVESVELSATLKLDLRRTVDRGRGRVVPLLRQKTVPDAPVASLPPATDRGALFPALGVDIGLGTALGKLRGARNSRALLQMALRFLATRYRGAVLFRVRRGAALPWWAAGEVDNWDELVQTPIYLDEPCTLAKLAREPFVHRGPLARTRADVPIARRIAGDSSTLGLCVSVCCGGTVRYVLCAFGPNEEETASPTDADLLADEISELLDRQAARASTTMRALGNMVSDPIAQLGLVRVRN